MQVGADALGVLVEQSRKMPNPNSSVKPWSHREPSGFLGLVAANEEAVTIH